MPDSVRQRLITSLASGLGFRVTEENFNDGQLKLKDGQTVGLKARLSVSKIIYRAATRLVKKHKILALLNMEWKEDRILLAVAKTFFPLTMIPLQRTMVASCLASTAKDSKIYILVNAPLVFDSSDFADLVDKGTLIFYRKPFQGLKQKVHGLSRIFYYWLIGELHGLKFLVCRSSAPAFVKNARPTVLVLKEDDLSLDRTRRGQPHWLSPDDPVPQFNTVVLNTSNTPYSPESKKLLDYGVAWMDLPNLYYFGSQKGQSELKRRLNRSRHKAMLQLLFGSSEVSYVFMKLERIFFGAHQLTDFCQAANVKAFMTCENYMHWVDSMTLVSKELKVKTLSYQYSNLITNSIVMFSKCDEMLTFSPLFHSRWKFEQFQPDSFRDVGYLYDSAFVPTATRASNIREQMAKNGVTFVLCYFDETVVKNKKYGTVNLPIYEEEFSKIVDYVLEDKSVGLVIKLQFQFNKVSRFKKLHHKIQELERQGRCIQISEGNHRNIVLPAEAAQASDFVIGELIGGTAVLESALAGVRTVAVNTFGAITDNDHIYYQADIIYPTTQEALKAIKDYRNKDPKRVNLGDWSNILHHFDPFRDGKAYQRTRNIIEQSVLR